MAVQEVIIGVQSMAKEARASSPVLGNIFDAAAKKLIAHQYPEATFKELDTIISRGAQYTKNDAFTGSPLETSLRTQLAQLRGGVFGARGGGGKMSPMIMLAIAGAGWFAWKNRAKIKRALK